MPSRWTARVTPATIVIHCTAIVLPLSRRRKPGQQKSYNGREREKLKEQLRLYLWNITIRCNSHTGLRNLTIIAPSSPTPRLPLTNPAGGGQFGRLRVVTHAGGLSLAAIREGGREGDDADILGNGTALAEGGVAASPRHRRYARNARFSLLRGWIGLLSIPTNT
ncbi:hypothetical protein LY76DRAFT_151140 [Colletotrichum caudatum]|nr:hypothetical protein LY76DRAFT_151140 [Colletotrichum caudatum]